MDTWPLTVSYLGTGTDFARIVVPGGTTGTARAGPVVPLHRLSWPPQGCLSVADDIVEYFILGYLGAGTGHGPALRQDPASAIIRCYVGDHERGGADRVLEARELSKASPKAFWFMVTLAKKHSSLCQEVLKSEFESDVLKLQRGVHDSSVHFAIESWSYVDSVSSYGPITLRAEVPLSSVLSLRAQEHEILLLRHPWESEIIIEDPQAASETELAPVAPWRDRLAGYLDILIGNLRSGQYPK